MLLYISRQILETNLRNERNFPNKAMVVNFIIFFIVKLPQSDQNDLYEWDELSADQPDVHQSHIGGRWQLLHHTSQTFYLNINCSDIPDEEGGDN